MEEVVPTAETWTLEGPRILQREHSSVSCRVQMITTRRTVPTSKGGHCRCRWHPGALRPGRGLLQPLRKPPATFSSAAGRTSSRPPPTSSSHSISILGPCGTTKTTNKVPTIVKQEEPEVPNKDPMRFQTLKLSAQSSPSVAPEAQKPAIVTGPLTPKAKQMPVRRGDVPPGTSIPTQPAYTTWTNESNK